MKKRPCPGRVYMLMIINEILESTVTEEEYALQKLQNWLQYEKNTWILGSGGFWLPYRLIITGLTIIAAIFIPYMLWHLIKAKWYKSIIIFVIVVIVPFIGIQTLTSESTVSYFLLSVTPLGLFYIFCWLLSYFIGERLTELQEIRQIEHERRKRKYELRIKNKYQT